MSQQKKLRFAFYVSGNASRLVKIIEMYPEIIENTFVVVNDEGPNQDLMDMLEVRKIDYIEYDYEQLGLKGNDRNLYTSNLLLNKFKDISIDFSFCFGGKILKGELLTSYRNKIINFHPSILPMFPGVKSIDKALNEGAFLLGNTAHFIDEGTDTGPAIMQSCMHSQHFSGYEDVIGLQLPMVYQIYCWLSESRLSVRNNRVIIEGANYSSITFYPKLEVSNINHL